MYDFSERILALAPWLTLVCIYFVIKSCTQSSVEPPESTQLCYDGPRHEYAIVVDPTGTVQVGVRHALSSSMNKVANIGSSIDDVETDEEEQRLLASENPDSHVQEDPAAENSVM